MDFVAQKAEWKKRTEPQCDRLFSGRRFSSGTTFSYFLILLLYSYGIRTYYSKVYYFGGSWTIVRCDSRSLFLFLAAAPSDPIDAQKKRNTIENPIIFGREKIINWKEKLRRLCERRRRRTRWLARTSTQWQWPVILWRTREFSLVFRLTIGMLVIQLCAHHYDLISDFFFSPLHYTEFSRHSRTRMIRLVISFSFNNKYFRSFCDSTRMKKEKRLGEKYVQTEYLASVKSRRLTDDGKNETKEIAAQIEQRTSRVSNSTCHEDEHRTICSRSKFTWNVSALSAAMCALGRWNFAIPFINGIVMTASRADWVDLCFWFGCTVDDYGSHDILSHTLHRLCIASI